MAKTAFEDKTEKSAGLTFFSKEQIICPICNTHFKREELKSGGGRLIAGDLTDELRRIYDPSAKYGEIVVKNILGTGADIVITANE